MPKVTKRKGKEAKQEVEEPVAGAEPGAGANLNATYLVSKHTEEEKSEAPKRRGRAKKESPAEIIPENGAEENVEPNVIEEVEVAKAPPAKRGGRGKKKVMTEIVEEGEAAESEEEKRTPPKRGAKGKAAQAAQAEPPAKKTKPAAKRGRPKAAAKVEKESPVHTNGATEQEGEHEEEATDTLENNAATKKVAAKKGRGRTAKTVRNVPKGSPDTAANTKAKKGKGTPPSKVNPGRKAKKSPVDPKIGTEKVVIEQCD